MENNETIKSLHRNPLPSVWIREGRLKQEFAAFDLVQYTPFEGL